MHGLLVDEYIEDRDANGDYILSFNEWAGKLVRFIDLIKWPIDHNNTVDRSQ